MIFKVCVIFETVPGLEPRSAEWWVIAAIRAVLEAAGVEFIPENGGGPGVRLRKGVA